MSLKNSNYIIGNRTSDLPTCSVVPEPTAPSLSANIQDLTPHPHLSFTELAQQAMFLTYDLHSADVQ